MSVGLVLFTFNMLKLWSGLNWTLIAANNENRAKLLQINIPCFIHGKCILKYYVWKIIITGFSWTSQCQLTKQNYLNIGNYTLSYERNFRPIFSYADIAPNTNAVRMFRSVHCVQSFAMWISSLETWPIFSSFPILANLSIRQSFSLSVNQSIIQSIDQSIS